MSPELKKRLPLFAAALVGLALIVGGIVWWVNGQRWESTDNAFVQADTTLVALDAKTGEVKWQVKTGDPAVGETNTATVLPVKDKVIVGISGGEFGVVDLQHVLKGQRLEVEAICGVVVGGDGLGVAVDHDGLEPVLAQRQRRVHAAVVELDALADAVRPAAQHHDLLLRRRLGLALFLVGRVHVGGVGGELRSPYTGKTVVFRRDRNATAVQIDHIVPLAYAWDMGAWSWDDAKRAAFANDPRNLVAVDGPANENKRDSPPGRWMPSNERFHCQYVRQFAFVARDLLDTAVALGCAVVIATIIVVALLPASYDESHPQTGATRNS